MAYQKHNFKERDKLFAAQMNTFETRVVKNEQKGQELEELFWNQRIACLHDGQGNVQIMLGGINYGTDENVDY